MSRPFLDDSFDEPDDEIETCVRCGEPSRHLDEAGECPDCTEEGDPIEEYFM